MFATLVIQLPSVHKGGEIVVKFGKSTKTLDFGQSTGRAPFSCFYAAHYADVKHEIKTVTSGYRLALVYSLCLQGKGQIPSATQLSKANSVLVPAIKTWSKAAEAGDKLIYFLDHEYTEGGLQSRGIDGMKGQDRAFFEALRDGNSQLPPDLQLSIYFALARLRLNLDATGYRDWEESDRELEIRAWYTIDGQSLPSDALLGSRFKFNQEEKAFLNKRDEDDVDEWMQSGSCESEEEGYTGNAGPSRTEEYEGCFAVIWPRRLELEAIATRGVESLVGYLEAEILEFQEGRRTKEAILKIGKLLISKWKNQHTLRYYERSHKGRFARQLVSIGDLALAREFLRHVAPKEPPLFGVSSLVKKFGWDKIGDLVCKLFKLNKSHVVDQLPGVLSLFEKTRVKTIPGLDSLLDAGIGRASFDSCDFKSGENLLRLLQLLKDQERIQKLAEKVISQATKLDVQRRLFAKLTTLLGLDKLATSPFKPLITSLIRGLQESAKTASVPNHSMPANVPPGESGLQHRFQAFLRSNETSIEFSGCFTGVGHARNWARKYEGLHTDWGYSVSIQAGGTGKNSFVTVRKTDAYKRHLEQRSQLG